MRDRRIGLGNAIGNVALVAFLGCGDGNIEGAGGTGTSTSTTTTADTVGATTATSTKSATGSTVSATGAGGAEPTGHVDLGVGFGVGPYHACIIQPDLSVTCFGAHQPRATPPDGFRAVAISSGHLHNCAILPPDADTRVGCYGFGYDGGNLPNEPPDGLDPIQIAVGEGTSCAVDADGSVACWYGGDLEADPPDGLRAKQISTTPAFTCAIDLDDEVVCWGLNPPELPETPLRARFIVAAQSEGTMDPPETRDRHACAIRLDDTVVCWGDDVKGEVDGVPDGLKAVDVALGITEACAVSTDGDLVCWGDPPGGFERPEGLRARAVRISHNNGCALLEDEDVLSCWGFNDPDRYAEGIPDGATVYVPE